ncbi:MAG: UDP-N-acetylmuramate--L-alanine ligase [Actinobacteria bacterium]|nr:UDP-N-acetylmuramate--L-alanine ligase [Actinomycetota bacterium]
MNLQQATSAHFVGIGGAGMSAIAKVLLERGVRISGSDLKRSRASTVLEAMGASVHIGHHAELVEGNDIVVRSSAIPDRNPEVRRAMDLDIPVLARGEALASLLRGQRSIVVAGTHGKTTTTSMIVSVLRHAGEDPTYLVGAGLNDVGTNARSGRGDLIVAESDESDGSFLLLDPFIAVITNVELDHVDYWADIAALRRAFATFAGNVQRGGVVVVPLEERNLGGDAAITFGADADVSAASIEPAGAGTRFELQLPSGAADVHLRVPGEHNVSNALAAAAACTAAGVALDDIVGGLQHFSGVERRFQIRGEASGVTVIDDYAHHPTEIRATLSAARSGAWGRVVALFQPHRYTRTAALASEFGASFAAADRVVVTDVYGAGEEPVPGVTGKLIADAICERFPGRSVAYIPHRAELLTYLSKSCRSGDALLTLGAGDVNSIGEELLARLGP